MTLDLLPPGAPGSDLGFAHTLKHWMNPREMWEDVAEAVPEVSRPRAQWEGWRARGVDPVAEATAPGPALTALWDEVKPAYADGYGACVRALADANPPPPGGDWLWRPKPGVWVRHAGEGVLLVVRKARGRWEMYTAYRRLDFRLDDYRCPPRDAASVSLRRKLAEGAARRRMAALRERGEG